MVEIGLRGFMGMPLLSIVLLGQESGTNLIGFQVHQVK